MNTNPTLRALAALLLALVAGTAQAHHLMDGQAPVTLMQGLLSGLAHPLIEGDHLLFLLGGAALVAVAHVPVGRGVQLLGAFAVAGSVGTAIHATGVSLPWTGTGVAVSLLVLAVALLRVSPGGLALLVIAVAGGMLHGYEYGESIAGAATLPALAYATGLLLIQALTLCLVHGGWSRVIERSPVWRPSARRALALVIGLAGAWALGVAG
jgi:urease accessory protein